MADSVIRPPRALGAIDAAAMHPSLANPDSQYYRECMVARSELKEILSTELRITHDIYVLANTTHGFVTTALGLMFDGFQLSARPDSYTPYQCIVPELHSTMSGEPVRLVTHISPQTGEIYQPVEASGRPTVVDVAQSFATTGFHQHALAADIFICPLHKHIGLARGLGLLAISPTAKLPNMQAVARMAEMGTIDLDVLSLAISRALKFRGRLVNLFCLKLRNYHRDGLERVGIRVVSPLNSPLPFAVLEGIDPSRLSASIVGTRFSFKAINKSGHIRISGAIRGGLGRPNVDHADELANLLERSHGSRRHQ